MVVPTPPQHTPLHLFRSGGELFADGRQVLFNAAFTVKRCYPAPAAAARSRRTRDSGLLASAFVLPLASFPGLVPTGLGRDARRVVAAGAERTRLSRGVSVEESYTYVQ